MAPWCHRKQVARISVGRNGIGGCTSVTCAARRVCARIASCSACASHVQAQKGWRQRRPHPPVRPGRWQTTRRSFRHQSIPTQPKRTNFARANVSALPRHRHHKRRYRDHIHGSVEPSSCRWSIFHGRHPVDGHGHTGKAIQSEVTVLKPLPRLIGIRRVTRCQQRGDQYRTHAPQGQRCPTDCRSPSPPAHERPWPRQARSVNLIPVNARIRLAVSPRTLLVNAARLRNHPLIHCPTGGHMARGRFIAQHF